MKTAMLSSLALLIIAGCSQPNASDSAAPANGTRDAAVAANIRPDGSIIDESKPHEHTGANAHAEPMKTDPQMAMMAPAAGDSDATRGYKQSMTRMMQGMPPYTGDADIDFNKQMRVHHLAAIDMAEVQTAQGADAETKALVRKIIADQRREVAQIDGWLQQRGQ